MLDMYLDEAEGATDWDTYLTPLLDGATDLGDAIYREVRAGDGNALDVYAQVRDQRQDAVLRMLDERGIVYERESFDHRVCGEATNIIATLPGGDAGTVYLTAHTDYVAGTGTEDNASGIAVAMAAIDRLRGYDLPFTIKIAVFDCEEVDAGGSRYHVEQLLPEEREDVLAVVNLDCVGSGKDLFLPSATYDITHGEGHTEIDQTLLDRLVASARAAGTEPVVARFGYYSDHDPFCHAGIAAATVGTADVGSWDEEAPIFTSPVHSPKDVRSVVNDVHLDRALEVVLGTVEDLAADVR